MNQKIRELMERMVIKMLEEDLNTSESTISSEDGKTIVSTKHNSLVSLLLYLQLTSGDHPSFQQSEGDGLEDLDKAEDPEERLVDFSEEEREEVLKKITALQLKNKQFQQEMTELLKDKSNASG